MKNLLFALFVTLSFIGCSNSSTSNTTNGNSNLSFKLDGTPWEISTGWGQSTTVDGKKIINVNGVNSENGMDQFGIKIHGFNGMGDYSPVNAGIGYVFTFSQVNSSTGTTKHYGLADQNQIVKITDYDAAANTVSGTFTLTLKEGNNTISLTEGQFTNIKLEVVPGT